MCQFVYKADHMLVLGTNTYFYKWENIPDCGIKTERSYANHRIIHEQRDNFTIPLIAADPVPPGHALFDGTGGVIGHHLRYGLYSPYSLP